MKFRAKLTIAMVLLLSLTYCIGGSFMIANFICVGLLMNVWMHRGAMPSQTAGKV